MQRRIAGRTASHLPGLDIAEQRSWQNYRESTHRLYALLNRQLSDQYQVSLVDLQVLGILDQAADGSARMGDLAATLASLPSKLTKQINRLEAQGLVRRDTHPEDRRGVVAAITEEGRNVTSEAMAAYAQGVRTHFLEPLSRPQVVSMEQNFRRINAALLLSAPPT